jgi:ABC-type multidrug transport system ATPase subunit
VPEGRRLFGKMTVIDNLRMGAYTKHARAAEEHRLEGMLAMFPRLAERRTQLASTMSGGEQQMVAIARALMSGPKLLLLDEPSLGLSPRLVKDLFATLHKIKESRQSVILVEQSVRQGLRLADYVYVLENGRIVRAGRPADIEADRAIQKAYLGLAGARADETKQPAASVSPAPAAVAPVRVAADVDGAAAARPRSVAPAPDTRPAHEDREGEMERRYAINRAFAAARDGFYHPFARTLGHAQPARAPARAAPAPVVAVQAPAVRRETIPTSGGFVNPQAMNPQARPSRL